MVDVTKGSKAPLTPLMGSVLIAGTVLAPRDKSNVLKNSLNPSNFQLDSGTDGIFEDLFRRATSRRRVGDDSASSGQRFKEVVWFSHISRVALCFEEPH